MNTNHRGFAAVAAIVIGLAVLGLGAGAYVAMKSAPAGEPAAQEEGSAQVAGEQGQGGEEKMSIGWRITAMGEVDGIPQTRVEAIINGEAHDAGTFAGTCGEVGASGGIDGKGLLVGELAAVQCWYAGGGEEIGVFAHEDGGVDILVGTLEEGAEGGEGMFRGDFKGVITLPM